jgi:hypothetical protein
VLIKPPGSAFARWLVGQQIAVVTSAGVVALPYAVCSPHKRETPIDQRADPPMSGRMALRKASTRASAYCGVSGPERSSQR